MPSFFKNLSNNIDLDLLHSQGCNLCPLACLPNKHRSIEPDGYTGTGSIYLLGLGPGKDEDAAGRFWVGRAGTLLKSCFTKDQWDKTRRNNVTRTRHPEDKPPWEALECCRPSVELDIAQSKPRIIFGFGGYALQWAFHQQTQPSIQAWRNHPFPIKILDHTCWFYPLFHPSYILHNKYLEDLFRLDIKRAYRYLDRNLIPEVVDPKTIFDNCYPCYSVNEFKNALIRLMAYPDIAVDLEYMGGRPYAKNARLFSIALGVFEESYSLPLFHPQHVWSPEDLKKVLDLLRKFLKNKAQRKSAHNMIAELEWLIHLYNDVDLAFENWHDTMGSGYCLNFGGGTKEESSETGTEKVYKGLLKLDNLCQAYFGFFLKSFSEVNAANLLREPLGNTLRYNAGDSRWTQPLATKLDIDLEYTGQQELARVQDEKIIAVILSQRAGIPYNIDRARQHHTDLVAIQQQSYMDFYNHPDTQAYLAKSSKLSITASADIARMFQDLGHDMTWTDDKDKVHLIADDARLATVDHPLVPIILKHREVTKLDNTYCKIFLPEEEGFVGFPDGLLHPEVTTCFTNTTRLSYWQPNCQNFPKKRNKYIRDIIVAPDGYILASFDYGQIEYRVIAMASKDPKLVEYILKNKDIHTDWSLKIVKLYPKRVGEETAKRWLDSDSSTLKKTDKLFDSFRGITKNAFVFAACFGAGVRKLAAGMKLPEDVMQEIYNMFWKELAGVREWQKWLDNFYKEHGYVESLVGFRRQGPIAHGEEINSPIQSTAAAIMMDAMVKLVKHGVLTKQYQFIPRISIHDDLSFLLPIKSHENDIQTVQKSMLGCEYSFVNVPLEVECSIGADWYHLEHYGTFTNAEEFKAAHVL